MGQFVSLVGTWMQQLAMSWLVYRLTQSTLWLGIVGFSSQIPTFFFSPFAGVFVDRVNRHRILLWTQGLAAVQALCMGILTLSGKINLTEIVVLSTFLGLINAVDMPTRQAFVVQMIEDRRDLANAIAINSSVMNGTRLVGPAIAGFLITIIGEGLCFLINSLSYLAVLFALTMMRVERHRPKTAHEPIGQSLRVGFKAAFGFSPIAAILILLSLLSLIGTPYITLFPAMADQIYHGDAHTLAILTVFSGAGALGATVLLATRKNVLSFGRMIGVSAVVFSVGLIALSVTTKLILALPILFCMGFTMMLQMASSNMVIQTLVEDDKRGRVMSLFTLALMGVAPIGGLLVGAMAQRFGTSLALCLCGILYLVTGIVFLTRLGQLGELVEPIYRKLGILPESEFTGKGQNRFVF